MDEEELDFFKEEIEKKEKNIKIIKKVIAEDYQFLVGVHNYNYFVFGVNNNIFFVESTEIDYKEFRKISNLLTKVLEEMPIEFVQVDERHFINYWADVDYKNNCKKVREDKKIMLRKIFLNNDEKKVLH